MSQIRGKQIKDQSVELDKLSGTGTVTFTGTGTSMTFATGTNLLYTDAPTQGTEVANKAYVDSIASGLDVKEAARLLSKTNITGTYNNGTSGVGATIAVGGTSLTIDGNAVADDDRVVLTGQSNAAHNGIYVVSGVGSAVLLTRTEDFDGNPSSEINGGEFVFIKEGALWADTGFVVSTPNDTITVGSDPINFTQFSAAGVITAGLGLVQNGTEFDIITGVGLTASANELKLDDTTVTSGSYGASGTVSTFTVDDQGRLTAAADVAISITSSQVTDFDSSVLSSVFEVANFVDSSSVDFNVTAGATVSADVKVNTGTGLAVGSSGVEINYGTGLTVSGSQLVVDATTFGVQGADNGLSIDGSSNVILGGTLSQSTSIDGDSSYSLNFENLRGFGVTTSGELDLTTDILDMNAGEATLDATTQFTLTTPTFKSNSTNTDFITDTFDVFADNSIALTATASGNVVISAGTNAGGPSFPNSVTFDIGADTIFTDLRQAGPGTGPMGIRYGGNYHSSYVNRSLVDKEYVDLGTASIWTAIQNSTYFAGDGIALNGLTFSADLDSDALQITAGKIDLKDTITGDRTFANNVVVSGDLTVNGTTTTINTQELTVEDNIITLNGTFSGAPVLDSGIEINRGNGATVSLLWDENDDFWSVIGTSGTKSAIITEAGTGLTKNGNTLSINTSGFSTALAGVGLTANGGALDVRATNGLVVDATSDSVELGGSLDQETIIDGQINNRFALLNTNGMTFSSVRNDIAIRTESAANNADIWVNTLGDDSDIIIRAEGTDAIVDIDANTTASMNAPTVQLATTNNSNLRMGNTSSTNFKLDFFSSIVTSGNSQGLKYATDYSATFIDESLITKRYVDTGTSSIWSAINAITGSDIEEITAGNGLTGGGTQGTVNVAVGDGAGIKVNADSIEVEITPQGGLTFSAAGAGGTLEVEVDGTTIGIVNGALTAIGGSAQPVYQAQNSLVAVGGPSAGDDTGLSLASTPNDYSRIEVYVNGQKQLLGGQGSFNESNSDCWFGSAVSATPLASLTSGDKLYWNSVTAGFRLDTSDLVEIAYEA